MISAQHAHHEQHVAGETPGAGTFTCATCATQVFVQEQDRLPHCPRCESARFERASIFEPAPGPPGGGTIELAVPTGGSPPPEWLAEARDRLAPGARALAYDDGGELLVFDLPSGWTRVGRSANAGIRLDDPTVSRRHALLVSEAGKPLRVLDDRSLNGILINDEPADWAKLRDGDALTIGRYRLVCIET